MAKQFTREEVAKHNKAGDVWIIVDTIVYDLSKFVDLHPGGAYVLLDKDVAGKECSESFFGLHKAEILTKYKRLAIGTIANEKPQWILPEHGKNSLVPYAEPAWLTRGYHSPYYNDSHHALQKFMREWTDRRVKPEAISAEESGKRPAVELVQEAGELGINALRMGPGPHLKGVKLPAGLKPESVDYFHELVVNQELARAGMRGFGDGFQGGMVIGLPPVFNFGSDALKKRIVPEVLAGRKYIALAISEAFAGSDVAGLRCVAEKTQDGKHWIVNGTKKWITNGTFADYFSTGCKTGPNELTMILIERDDNVDTKQIKTSYSTTAGTAYITFDNVKVPVENTLGKVGDGLKVILSNFNHERYVMATGSVAASRLITEQCFVWAHVRKAFGKSLITQPVIRQKLAHMFAQVEANQAWLEHIGYQMCKMTYAQQSALLAGQIGILKMACTRTETFVSDNAVQILGGRGITKGGLGGGVEMHQRTFKFNSILGGAEEVLGDLAVKQAMKMMPNKGRVAMG